MEPKVKNFLWHFPECDSLVKKYFKYLENADIIDIGSNVGFFTIAIINNLKYKSIDLFEPSEE